MITGLMVTGVVHQVDRFAGIRPDGALTASVELRREAYPDAASVARYFTSLHERLLALPGVREVAFAEVLPGFSPAEIGFHVEGRDEPVPEPGMPAAAGAPGRGTRVVAVSPGYFRSISSAVLQGRDLAWSDGPGSLGAALVNRRFVENILRALRRSGSASSSAPAPGR